VGAGRAFYEQVVARGLEGVVAKHLASRYLPGRRSEAWVKIKPRGSGRQHGPAGPLAAVRA
jgi:ATP-dependent DNA ligase